MDFYDLGLYRWYWQPLTSYMYFEAICWIFFFIEVNYLFSLVTFFLMKTWCEMHSRSCSMMTDKDTKFVCGGNKWQCRWYASHLWHFLCCSICYLCGFDVFIYHIKLILDDSITFHFSLPTSPMSVAVFGVAWVISMTLSHGSIVQSVQSAG